MKKEDKLLFLAELVGYDVSSFLSTKQDEFLQDETMTKIKIALQEQKKNTSFKYQVLSSEYDLLKEAKIDSMEKYVILTGKANHIYYSFANKKYINPLFSFDDGEHLLSSIIVSFDGKDTFLGDLVLKEDYTDTYKIDCVKQHLIDWYKEVKDNFIYPLQAMLTHPHNLPKRKLISTPKIVYGSILLIINLVYFFLMFSNSELIKSSLQGDFSAPYFAYPFVGFYYLLFVIDFLYIFSIFRRYKYVKKYLEGQELLFKNSHIVVNKLDKSTENLYKHILYSINNKIELKGDVLKFSKLGIEYKTFLYMKSINDKDSLTQDVLFTYEILFIQIIFVLSAYFIIYFYFLSEVIS